MKGQRNRGNDRLLARLHRQSFPVADVPAQSSAHSFYTRKPFQHTSRTFGFSFSMLVIMMGVREVILSITKIVELFSFIFISYSHIYILNCFIDS